MEVACHWVSRVDATGRLYFFTLLPKEKTTQDQEWFVVTLICFEVLDWLTIRWLTGVKEHLKTISFAKCALCIMNFTILLQSFLYKISKTSYQIISAVYLFRSKSFWEKLKYFYSFIHEFIEFRNRSWVEIFLLTSYDYIELSQKERLHVIN